MRNPLGDLPLRHHGHDLRRLFATAIHEIKLRLHGRLAALYVRRSRLIQKPNAVDRIVELRNDGEKLRFWQIRKRILKRSERTGRELRLRGIRNDVDRRIALKEGIETPRILVPEDVERLHALGLQMVSDADDVRLEDVLVEGVGDALQNVTDTPLRLNLERVVDVS